MTFLTVKDIITKFSVQGVILNGSGVIDRVDRLRQTDKQTDTTENNTTVAARVIDPN